MKTMKLVKSLFVVTLLFMTQLTVSAVTNNNNLI